LVRNVINIDRGEVAYFNFVLNTESNVEYEIRDPRATRSVTTHRINGMKAGVHNYELGWDGYSSTGNKISEGTYEYTFKVMPVDVNNPYANPMIVHGTIKVTRNETHLDEPIVIHSPRTNSRILPEVERAFPLPLNRPTNESLITRLSATPSMVNGWDQFVDVNFETMEKGPITSYIIDASNGTIVKQLTKGRWVFDGYHRGTLPWDLTIANQPAANGRYIIIMQTMVDNFIDIDEVSVTINRGYVQRQNNSSNQSVRPYVGNNNNLTEGNCLGFTDVNNSDSLCQAIDYVIGKGVVKIDGNVKYFRPNDYITRAEAAAMIMRLNNISLLNWNPERDGNLGFSDLNSEAWYMPYIKTIIKTAIQDNERSYDWVSQLMEGYPDGTMRPTEIMSHAEFYKVFVEALENSNMDSDFYVDYHITDSPFADVLVNEDTAWYLPYADWAKRYLSETAYAEKYFGKFDLSNGVARFKADKGITRGEVIDLIYTCHELGLM
jgi:hypothetical protein